MTTFTEINKVGMIFYKQVYGLFYNNLTMGVLYIFLIILAHSETGELF